VDFLHVVLLFLVVVMFSSVVNISQVIGWEGWVFCTSQEKIVSEMTYNVYRAGRLPLLSSTLTSRRWLSPYCNDYMPIVTTFSSTNMRHGQARRELARSIINVRSAGAARTMFYICCDLTCSY